MLNATFNRILDMYPTGVSIFHYVVFRMDPMFKVIYNLKICATTSVRRLYAENRVQAWSGVFPIQIIYSKQIFNFT